MQKLLYLLLGISLSYSALAQCNNFGITSDKTSVCAPELVRFEVENSIDSCSYEWDLGQGWINGSESVITLYDQAGVYDISVRITLPNGSQCNITETDMITVHAKPIAVISASSFVLCNGPEELTFTDISANSQSRNWIVDGTNYIDAAKNITHKFTNTGSKNISLIITDSFGCQGVTQHLDTIKVYEKPVFDIDFSTTRGCAPRQVSMEVKEQKDYAGSYHWTLEGTTSNQDSGESIGPYTYSNAGMFDVTIELAADNGCTYILEKPDYLRFGESQNLNLNINNTSLCKGDAVMLKLNPGTIEGNIKWSYAGVSVDEVSIDDFRKEVYPSSSGNLEVKITANYNGCTSQKTFNALIDLKQVKANFSSDDNFHCLVPHTVHLDNTSDKMDADSLDFIWNIYFQDSLIHSSTNIDDSLNFNFMPASYDVELIARGNNGCADTMLKKGFIYQDSLDVDFVADPEIGCVGQIIEFVNTTKQSTAYENDQFKWTFFDKDGNIVDSSDQRNAEMIYSDTGFYSAELIGYNSFGCEDTLALEAVQIIDPLIDFNISDSILCLGESVQLSANNSPMLEDMSHHWKLEHIASGDAQEFNAEEIELTPWAIGEYILSYSFKINGGCERTKTMNISVNGVEGEIILDSMQACAPFKLNPRFNVSSNNHQGQNSADLFYQWTVSPNTYTIDDTAAELPRIVLLQEGFYAIELTLTNSTACTAKFDIAGIQAGVIADFEVDDDIICFGDSFVLSNLSSNQNTTYRYELAGANFEVYHNQDESLLYSLDSGQFNLMLIAEKDGLCADTASIAVEVIQVVADFISNDTFLKCAPVYVQFQSKSVNYDSLYWDFGDGQSYATTEQDAGNIYMSNSGQNEGFDVTLFATNKEGCTDSIFKQDFIAVSGPKPKFSFVDPQACDSALVVFKDLSQGAVFYAMDYHDGSALDSSFSSHLFKKLTTDSVETFYPTLYASDDNGCVAKFTSEIPITLYESPKADFIWDDTAACAPYALAMLNTSTNASEWAWEIDQQMVSSLENPTLDFIQYGMKEVKLTATNQYACKDETIKMLRVEGSPVIELNVLDSICLYNNIGFEAELNLNSFFDSTEINLYWDFGQEGHPDRYQENINKPFFTYSEAGIQTVGLRMELSNGCSDSISMDLYFRGAEELDNPQFKSLSFLDGFELELNHETTDDKHFAAYNFERSDGASYQSSNQAQNSWTYDFVSRPDSSLCYDLNIVDNCGLLGSKSIRHCFIFLNIESSVDFQNQLEWTPYIGWAQVDEYRVYRRKAGESFERIATLNGQTLEYLDDGLCKESYEYYVQAYKLSTQETANSFKVQQLPKSNPNAVISSIANATVISDSEVEIRWEASDPARLDHFILNKYNADQSYLLESIELEEESYLDQSANTNEASYVYTVQEVDLCGEKSQVGRIGKTILLSAIYDDPNLEANLNWTAYEEWENGVSAYQIELVSTENQGILSTTNGSTLNYTDQEIRNTDNGDYCYRIAASNEAGDTSHSNVVCVHGDPMAYIPTAFSPNKDGLNDQFRPITRFVDHQAEVSGYQLEIYNRWGEQIYQSNELMDGWDGSYKGKECPQDVYIFKIQYRGANSRLYNHRGTLTLIK